MEVAERLPLRTLNGHRSIGLVVVASPPNRLLAQGRTGIENRRCCVSKRQTGLVVGKDFRPPEGGTPLDWCYLTIDLSDDQRFSIRISRDQVNKADIGDVISFRRPRGEHPVQRVRRLGSEPGLLPPVSRSGESD